MMRRSRHQCSTHEQTKTIGTDSCEPGNHVVLTNYEQFRIHEKEFKETGFDRFVFDESSKLKNRDAKVSKSGIRSAESCREVYLLEPELPLQTARPNFGPN